MTPGLTKPTVPSWRSLPVKIAHVTVSAIPLVTPTEAVVATVTYVGSGPSISNITPASAAKDATVTVTITGNNFQTGAIPKLVQPGSAPVTGTAVSVSSTSITTTFNMYQMDEGDYNIIVTNPDGRSDILQNAFNIGNAQPVVNSITPDSVALNDTDSTYTIDWPEFRDRDISVLPAGIHNSSLHKSAIY